MIGQHKVANIVAPIDLLPRISYLPNLTTLGRIAFFGGTDKYVRVATQADIGFAFADGVTPIG